MEQVGIDNLRAFTAATSLTTRCVVVAAFERRRWRASNAIWAHRAPDARAAARAHCRALQEGARELVVTRPGDSGLVAAQYHVSAGAHPDTTALAMLTIILGDTPGGRLYKALVERKQATSVGTSFSAMKAPRHTALHGGDRKGPADGGGARGAHHAGWKASPKHR
ncbi:hypothetical protein ACTMU2_27350 [Cupriavidus basilensis]